MPVTIQLNDALAAQLQKKAAARRLSLEEFTVHLLDGALGEMETADQWGAQNGRRLDLIRKSCTSSLSSDEQLELQELQAALDHRLEPLDDRLLESLRHWQGLEAACPWEWHGVREADYMVLFWYPALPHQDAADMARAWLSPL